jgi:RNA polymerase sigma-70 factor (ECF subfamily)
LFVSEYPETRASLIVRLQAGADQAAWAEFVEIYQPVIYRLARRRGLQDADADDLSQQVLAAVARAVSRWRPDANRGRFRAWLNRIARNRIINALTRRAPDRAAGGADDVLVGQPATGPDSALLRIEYRRGVFQWAARQVRGEFRPETWEAFWQTAVEGRPIAAVAAALNKGAGAIYTARGRVMRRLREKVFEWGLEEAEPPGPHS